jgi:hypothetical protein
MQTNKPLNKIQIDAVIESLNSAITKKRNEIKIKNFKKDIAQYETLIKNLCKKAIKLREEVIKTKEIIEKNPKLKMETEGYHSWMAYLPENIKDAEEMQPIESNPKLKWKNNGKDPYEPNLEKEEKEVEQFILNLKLGTALMTDLKPLLDKINNIK